jgi:glutathione-regulated potassium-efflux system protein KefB
MDEAHGQEFVKIVVLLGAAVVVVPIFRRIGLGSVLGYLAAGLAIGPFGFGWFADPMAILHVAELGVVMFLFVIGLEMKPSHLWSLRREIFGLGTIQIAICTGVLFGIVVAFGFEPRVAAVGSMGFVLTSTAIVMQILAERGDIALPRGQRIVSILLFEDLLIVPLLVVVTFMAPGAVQTGGSPAWQSVLLAVGTFAALIVAGIWLLNPLFRLLAAARAREVMTAAALLVVLGAAVLMEFGGLSMALGAFVAGVLLSNSSFRHQLEADIEPFRGLLLGLFFLGVGMSLDLDVVGDSWRLLLLAVPVMMVAKGICIFGVARLLGADRNEALDRAVVMAQGGEFAFVLYAAAVAASVIDGPANAKFTALVVLSMAMTPLAMIVARRLTRAPEPSMDGVEIASGLSGSVLLIGFGRFGQIVSQALLARDVDVTIIDSNVEMIRGAERFGFKVYYGDGSRLDVLRASGAEKARALCVCIDDKAAASRIVELAKAEFPHALVLVRAFDRAHALDLIHEGASYQIRETLESALAFGEATLRQLGVPADQAAEICADVRRRDEARLEMQLAGDIYSGKSMLHGNIPRPEPLTKPRRESRSLNPETGAPTDAPAEPPDDAAEDDRPETD